MDLRIATCHPLPEPDPDEAPLIDALARRGVNAEMLPWDDAPRWADSRPTVIRSTWNYLHDVSAFITWAERVFARAPLWNPPGVVRWNAHKRYLQRLAEAGFAVVPTVCVPRGDARTLEQLATSRGWSDVVVKPAVSAGSFATQRYRADAWAEGDVHLRALVAERDVLVQPYVDSVENYGERALVWIDGALTHAVRKSPRLSGEDEAVGTTVPIGDDERALATDVINRVAPGVLYARVDVAPDAQGAPRIMELELIEPSLFLVQHPPALDRLADAIARRASRRDDLSIGPLS